METVLTEMLLLELQIVKASRLGFGGCWIIFKGNVSSMLLNRSYHNNYVAWDVLE